VHSVGHESSRNIWHSVDLVVVHRHSLVLPHIIFAVDIGSHGDLHNVHRDDGHRYSAERSSGFLLGRTDFHHAMGSCSLLWQRLCCPKTSLRGQAGTTVQSGQAAATHPRYLHHSRHFRVHVALVGSDADAQGDRSVRIQFVLLDLMGHCSVLHNLASPLQPSLHPNVLA